ncbi:uncharacterized protein JCM15063_001137 [Sporobolomyces koalae]|uniref:uncharacterized protein n=1 Tax=Sporobolomyces koalae TaxID=500713 RepID=UPI00317E25FD
MTTTEAPIAPFGTEEPNRPLPVRDEEYIDDGHDDGEEEAAGLLDEKPQRTRSDSILSFDLSNRLIIAPTVGDVERNALGTANDSEQISLVAGIALIVGLVIGSGIFASSGVVAREVGSVGASLLVWLLAGLLSWAGGSSLAELGSALPMNGGAQAYLQSAYGSLPSYCFSFTAVTALKPGSQAIISIIAGEYICRVLFHTAFSSDPQAAARGVPTWAIKLVAIFCVLFVSTLQAWSTKLGTRMQVVTTSFKVIAICFIFGAGIVWLGLGRVASSFSFEGATAGNPTGWALALFSALWAYDGFDQANYVARSCKPGDLPKMINISLGTIVVLFSLANIAYFIVLPFELATATATIGLDFGRAIAGPIGALLFAIIVGVSCISALNSSLYTSARLVVAAGEQGFLPKAMSKFNKQRQTPINGILLSCSLSTIYILIGDFSSLSVFYGVCAWTWNFLVVVGLLVLRVKEPNLKRPYRTYLVTPILFASTALFLLVLSAFSRPLQSLGGFLFCGAGAIPYYVQTRRKAREFAQDVEMT